MDIISKHLELTPLSQEKLRDIEQRCKDTEHSIQDTSPFNQSWFNSIRVENGKQSGLVKKWNGSDRQREFLRKALKDRKITWGDKITLSKSHGIYTIIVDGVEFKTPSINKFAKEHRLNAASLRLSLWNNKPVQTKGCHVVVSL